MRWRDCQPLGPRFPVTEQVERVLAVKHKFPSDEGGVVGFLQESEVSSSREKQGISVRKGRIKRFIRPSEA